MVKALTPKQARQVAEYRANMGAEATERALAESRRCTPAGPPVPAPDAVTVRQLAATQVTS